jgi:hypothetical protein
MAEFLAIVVLERDPGAEENPTLIGGRFFDHRHAIETLAQEAHAPIDLAQPLFSVRVFGILGAVALRRGLGHGLRDARSLDFPQLVQFLLQACCTCGGDEL